MQPIEITEKNIISFYGNKAGYIKDGVAVVDTMFQREELVEFLREYTTEWKNGVFDTLSQTKAEEVADLKRCRIYQLTPETDVRMRFISYEKLIMQGFGKPRRENYSVVFDGAVNTNELEELLTMFNAPDHSEYFVGRELLMSDVIELYDDIGSQFFYVDDVGFREIKFLAAKAKKTSKGAGPETLKEEKGYRSVYKFIL